MLEPATTETFEFEIVDGPGKERLMLALSECDAAHQPTFAVMDLMGTRREFVCRVWMIKRLVVPLDEWEVEGVTEIDRRLYWFRCSIYRTSNRTGTMECRHQHDSEMCC